MTESKKWAWWEKTVEYTFVRNILPPEHSAYPLDGAPETAYGDLLTRSSVMALSLIEFKIGEGWLEREASKLSFSRVVSSGAASLGELAMSRWGEDPATYAAHGAHVVIYGRPATEIKKNAKLDLFWQPYWGSEGRQLSSMACLPGCNSVDDFVRYLGWFRGKRKTQGKGGSSGGGMALVDTGSHSVAIEMDTFMNIIVPQIELARGLGSEQNSDPERTQQYTDGSEDTHEDTHTYKAPSPKL